MRLGNVIGLIACAALLGAPGVAAAQAGQAGQPATGQEQQERQAPETRTDDQRVDQQARAQHGQEVDLRDIRNDPQEYLGQTVTFEANVDGVLGPRLVRLGSTAFFDWFGGSILAYSPDALGMAVSDRDRVTVTGTVEQYQQAQLQDHMTWIDPGEDIDERMKERAVVRITSIMADDQRNALIHAGEHDAVARQEPGIQQPDVQQPGTSPQAGDRTRTPDVSDDRERDAVGTTGRDAEAVGTTGRIDQVAIRDLDEVAGARTRDVGRKVHLQEVQVERALGDRFFLASTDRDDEYVLVKTPEQVDAPTVQAGQKYTIEGVIMQMPERTTRLPGVGEQDRDRVTDKDVYVLATQIDEGAEARQQELHQPQQQPQPQQN